MRVTKTSQAAENVTRMGGLPARPAAMRVTKTSLAAENVTRMGGLRARPAAFA